MMVNLRNKAGELRIKDLLDLDLDMSVRQEDGRYIIRMNRTYSLDEIFDTRAAAEDTMIWLAERRNQLEDDLLNY